MNHKFWRLVVSATGSRYFQVSDVAFLNAEGADVSVGGVASASSEYGPGYTAANAFDKSSGTDYCNAVDQFPARLQYACPSPVDVASVRFAWANNATWLPSSPDAMVLMSSVDGIAWVDNYALTLTSGGFVAGTVAIAAVAHLGLQKTVPMGSAMPLVSFGIDDQSTSVLMAQATVIRDVEFGGAGTVYGTTEIKGTPDRPTKARVRLFRDRDALLARETWSDPITGAFAFEGLDVAQKFTALTEDAEGNFRPVSASRLVPEVLP